MPTDSAATFAALRQTWEPARTVCRRFLDGSVREPVSNRGYALRLRFDAEAAIVALTELSRAARAAWEASDAK